MSSTLQQYTLEDFVKCRNQKEWICDECRNCGDRDCCSGNHIMFRVPKTDDCLCSICMSKLKWNFHIISNSFGCEDWCGDGVLIGGLE